jgi:hypothetical protein
MVAIAAVVVALFLVLSGDGDGTAGGSTAQGMLPPSLPLEPIPPERDTLVGGANNETAATIARDTLQRSGMSMNGIDAYVFPVEGTAESILVLDSNIAGVQSQPSTPGSDDRAMAALVASPELKAANVTRIVFVIRGTDSVGPYAITMTMPFTTLDAMSKGTLTDAQAQQQMGIEVTR